MCRPAAKLPSRSPHRLRPFHTWGVSILFRQPEIRVDRFFVPDMRNKGETLSILFEEA